jgi:hypothetical protein
MLCAICGQWWMTASLSAGRSTRGAALHSAARRFALLIFLLAGPACPSNRTGTTPAPDRNVITREQIMERRFNNAYEAVEALHASWLSTRGTDSFSNPGQVWVYLDNMKLGGVERLREIATSTIASIRYFDAAAASARWGMDHGNGVILVSTRI